MASGIGDKMSNWIDYFKKKIMNQPITTIGSTPNMGVISGNLTTVGATGWISPTTQAYNQSYNITSQSNGNMPSTVIGGTAIGNAHTTGFNTVTFNPVPSNIFTAYSNSSKEIVRLNADGSVVWNGEIDVDAAAEAFGRSITIGAEISAGITKRVKLKMRDSVFEDIISIAKEKGPLSAEELTYILEASKIVEKLKGGKE